MAAQNVIWDVLPENYFFNLHPMVEKCLPTLTGVKEETEDVNLENPTLTGRNTKSKNQKLI